MSFLGSEKYPKENYFDSFVSGNGGETNAYTESETTVYSFDINHAKFEHALDIFASFFAAPKISDDCAGREIEAIESEFQLATQSVDAQGQQILCLIANEGHPVRCLDPF